MVEEYERPTKMVLALMVTVLLGLSASARDWSSEEPAEPDRELENAVSKISGRRLSGPTPMPGSRWASSALEMRLEAARKRGLGLAASDSRVIVARESGSPDEARKRGLETADMAIFTLNFVSGAL